MRLFQIPDLRDDLIGIDLQAESCFTAHALQGRLPDVDPQGLLGVVTLKAADAAPGSAHPIAIRGDHRLWEQLRDCYLRSARFRAAPSTATTAVQPIAVSG